MKQFYRLLIYSNIPAAVSGAISAIMIERIKSDFFRGILSFLLVFSTVFTAYAQPTDASITGDQTICEGNSASLTVTITGGVGPYEIELLKDGSNPETISNVTSGVSFNISPSNTVTYTLQKVTDSNSDELTTNLTGSATVTVDPLPTAPTSASVDRNDFCTDDAGDISLSVSGGSGTTLRWFTGSCGGSEVGTGNPLTIPSPTSTTTYYARWENSCGVSTCQSVEVNVINTPSPTGNTSQQFCSIDNPTVADLNATGTSIKWYSVPSGGTALPTSTVLSNGNYYASQTLDGCESTSRLEVSVVVTTTPDEPNASSNSPVCEGETINLTVDNVPGATYRWTGPTGFDVGEQNPSIVNATTSNAGAYTVTVSIGTCSSSSSIDVIVNETPDAPVASSNSPVCEGSAIELTASTVSGTNYEWTGPDGFSSNAQNPTIANATAAKSGTYSVTATLGSCTSAQASTDVTVATAPSAPTASSNSPVCEGSTINLTASTISGASYNWTGPDGFTSMTQNPTIPNATAAKAGTYSVTAVIGSCTSAPSTTNVTISPTPSAPTASSNSPVCEGGTINLTAATISGADYEWSGPDGFTSTAQNPSIPSATTSKSGVYSVTATINGCSNSSSTGVVVNARPNLVITDPAPVNEPNTVDITAPAVTSGSSAGTLSYWTNASATSMLTDPDAISTSGTYYIKLTNASGCFSIGPVNVSINRRPTSTGIPDQNFDEDQVVTDFDLRNYFSDVEDGNNLTFNITDISVPGILNASINGNLLSIALLANQSGSTSITIRATDTDNAFIEDVMDIIVDPVNDLPTSQDNSITIDEGSTYNFSVSDFPFNDIETSSLVSIKIVALPSDGTLRLSGTAVSSNQVILSSQISNLTYTPVTNENGTPYTSFLFSVSDGTDDSSPANTMTINVTPVNDPPTSSDNSITAVEDVEYIFQLSEFPYSDPEDDPFVRISITSIPGAGTLRVNSNPVTGPRNVAASAISSGGFTFIPAVDENGTPYTTFRFRVNDGALNSVEEYTMTINVSSVNDRPSFDIQPSHSSNENDNTQTIPGFASNIDDGDPEVTQSITFSTPQITSTTGILEFNQAPAISSTGTLTYRAKPNTNGSATLTVFCSDSGLPGQNSITKSFTINVAGENGPPSFDLNGNPPAVNEDPGTVTEPAFAINIDDGDEELNQGLTFNLTKTSGSLQFVSIPTINSSTGNLTYTPSNNSNGTATFSVTLTDNGIPNSTSSAQSFTITVNAVDDPPTGANQVKTINEDATYTFQTSDFTYNDTEGDNPGGIIIVSTPTQGELRYNNTAVTIGQVCSNLALLTYRPIPNQSGSPYATFEFKVRDANGVSSIADYTYTINVNPVNDPPTSADGEVSTLENITYSFSVADFPFFDVDNHTFNGIRIRSLVSEGSLQYNNINVVNNQDIPDVTNLKFIPAPNENGSPYTTFNFQVRDSQGSLSLSTYTMSISVGAVNDRPTGGNGSVTTQEDINYIFKTTDFTFNDVDGHDFAGIQIITLETDGDLEYNGTDVEEFDLCPDVSRLVFKPFLNENGSPYATFTFKVRDNSGSFDLSQDNYTMTINITAVNDPPSFTINSNPPTINEDAGPQVVANFATAINDGDPELNQALTFIPSIESTTGNLTFAVDPGIDASTGELSYEVSDNTNGIATISVILQDNGSGTNTSPTEQFTITVNSINDPPTLNPIADPAAINEDAGEQTVNLSGITAGGSESQALTVTATSSNTSLIPTPAIVYTSPNTTGQVKYTPALNMNGTAVITVMVNDGQSNNNTVTRSFTVEVNPVNDPPTINPIPDPPAIPENAIAQTLDFSGVSPGGGADEASPNQTVTITATSSNPSLIPNPTVSYENNTTGQLTYQPLLDQNGTTTITVTLDDGQAQNSITTETFLVTVSSVNNPPTIDDITDPDPINEDAPAQSILLTGITAGGGENQELIVTAVSDNENLIPNANINLNYTSPQTAGELTYELSPNQFGSATITVTVQDEGEENSTTEKQFTVTVNPIADTPSVTDAVANGDLQTTSGLVITKNPVDGSEVNHYKITEITNGTLYFNDGSAQILNDQFISTTEGGKGLRFTPTPGNMNNGSFNIQAATANNDVALGGEIISAFILRNSFPTSLGFDPVVVDEDQIIAPVDLINVFEDPDNTSEELTFEITVNSNPDLFASIEIVDQTLEMTLELDQFGVAQVSVTATDPYGASVTDVLDITVNPINDAPRLITPPITLGNQDLDYVYDIEFIDPENDAITVEISELPDWLTFTDNGNGTASITGLPGQPQVGIIHSIAFYAFDSEQNASDPISYELTIQNENDPPEIISNANAVVEVGDYYDYLVLATDPDNGDVLSFTVEFLDGAGQFLDYIENGDGSATIFGTFPSGTIGEYRIRIVVKDLALDSAEQEYTLRVKKANAPPELTNIRIPIDEDITYQFTTEDFTSRFSDPDGDTLQHIIIIETPLSGQIMLNGAELSEGDTVFYEDLSQISYVPKENGDGNDFFRWNASDGTDYALVPSNVTILINPVLDPPEIINFESDSILYELANTEGVALTEGTVFDGDGDNIAEITITIFDNYVRGEDVLSFDETIVDGLTYVWDDSLGVLTISGLKNANDYTLALQSVKYVNLQAISPTVDPRQIEILIYDVSGQISIPFIRPINFEDTYVELDIPDGFTPNGDDVNDIWEIENLTRYEDHQVIVYSRAGRVLFESRDYTKEWDGTYQGEVVPGGVYYYTIKVFQYQRKYSGTVTILR
jgi:gliding motility-associated-like protein